MAASSSTPDNVVDAEQVDDPLHCSICGRETWDQGMIGKQCGLDLGGPRCRGRFLPELKQPRDADGVPNLPVPTMRKPPPGPIDHAPGQTVSIIRGRVLQSPTVDPDDVVSAEADEMYWEGIPENTQKVYTAQWQRFVMWCGDHGREHLPATVATIREWINAHWTMTNAEGRLRGRGGQPYAPDTIRLSLAVISVVHQAHDLPNPGHHVDVIRQMRGYARRWKKAGYRADVAHALTPAEVDAMMRTLDLTTCAGLRDAALIRLTYDIGRRNSEMLALNWTDLRWVSPAEMEVHPPFSKTDKDTDEDSDVVTVESDVDLYPDLCPLLLIREWFELCSARGVGTGAVFKEVKSGARRKQGHSGVITGDRMTRRGFQDAVAKMAKASGVDRDPITGAFRQIVPHSLRAGFATASEESGVPIQATADRGGWSRESPVILRYYRTGKKRGAKNPAVIIRKATKRAAEEAAAAAAKEDQER